MRVALILAALSTLARAETRPHYIGKIEGALLGAPHVLDPVGAQSHACPECAAAPFHRLMLLFGEGAALERDRGFARGRLERLETTERLAVQFDAEESQHASVVLFLRAT